MKKPAKKPAAKKTSWHIEPPAKKEEWFEPGAYTVRLLGEILNQPPREFWILWNPDHHTPPRARFCTLKAAQDAAARMARKHAPHVFYICHVASKATVQETPVNFEHLAKAASDE